MEALQIQGVKATYTLGWGAITFDSLKGKTFQHVIDLPLKQGLLFEGEKVVYALLHNQQCCETVDLEDINGDLTDLENSEILSAEETTREEEPDPYCHVTWTFYHLRTMKGTVSLRFYGSSNGYYSERVTLFELMKLT